ncbi:tetratricopeptide repeat protein [Streptomyces sp. ISL-99]|uniref:tetratricopeptide repeat protein n=1 Tax=Streptomyces sp. ISL-99 TaxID=2819193 RepID=UPI001BED3CBB|nr:tetratricopeptide repeat protein [Streptomyces sp. ISL-99]MBT2529357.1 tetratricopeptide repeat protein [Streptomyces sp. ISL-99]
MRLRRLPQPRRTLLSAAVVTTLGLALFLAGGLGLAPWPSAHNPRSGEPATGPPTGRDPMTAEITALQERLRRTPKDPVTLGTLGLNYVQQVKTTGDPTYYPKAEEVLERSLALDTADNYTAMGGMAALEAARHNFTRALDWSKRAIALNPYSSFLYGTLADAYTQLGRYSDAADAVQKMVDLKPGTPSLARASYAAELRGDTVTARTEMRRALKSASGPTDQAFARYYLSEIAFNNGDPATALSEAEAGLRTAPSYTSLLQIKARAQAALGKTDAAIADLTRAVQRLPLPEYVLQLGELYQSLGRHKEAVQQYEIFRAEQKLFADNGVTPDSDAVLFEADHGDRERALAIARQGVENRPFLDSHDALAWALHVNGRDEEALAESDRALALGTRNALFHYHRAMIQHALGNHSAARSGLTKALAINPHFNPLQAPKARAALNALRPAGAEGVEHEGESGA